MIAKRHGVLSALSVVAQLSDKTSMVNSLVSEIRAVSMFFHSIGPNIYIDVNHGMSTLFSSYRTVGMVVPLPADTSECRRNTSFPNRRNRVK